MQHSLFFFFAFSSFSIQRHCFFFLALLHTYFFSDFMKSPQKKKKKNLSFSVLSSHSGFISCSTNAHFSIMASIFSGRIYLYSLLTNIITKLPLFLLFITLALFPFS